MKCINVYSESKNRFFNLFVLFMGCGDMVFV